MSQGPRLWAAMRQSLAGLERVRDKRKVEVAADPVTGVGGKSIVALLIDGFLGNLILIYRLVMGVGMTVYVLWILLVLGVIAWHFLP